MSLLSADVHAELTQLLQALQSADNGIRSQAEEHLQNNWTGARPEVLLMGLAEQVQGAGDNAVRTLPCPSLSLACLPAFGTPRALCLAVSQHPSSSQPQV